MPFCEEWRRECSASGNRVFGDFPEQAEDALTLLRWLEAAGTHVVSSDGGTLYAGIEMAGPGEDETVAVIRDSWVRS